MTIYERNFRNDFREIVSQKKDCPAIFYENDIVISYIQLDDYINKILIFYQQCGLKPGDTVLALMPNSPEALVFYLATIKGGYGYAPLPCNVTESELKRWINIVKPSLCVKKVGILNDICLTENIRIVEDIKCDGKFDFLLEKAADNTPIIYGDMPRLYLATSGTTGEPKAMVFDSNILWSSGCYFSSFHNLKEKNINIWNYLPVSYLGGLFNLCLIPLASAGSIVITEPFSGKTFLNFWQTVTKYKINALWFVPTIIKGLLSIAGLVKSEKIKEYTKEIKIAFLGTAPIDLQTKKEFEEKFNVNLLENFALSETTFFSTETVSNLKIRQNNSVGEILPYVDVKIDKIDEETNWGEIKVKTPFLFLGYLNNNGEISKNVDEKGFFSTGDNGYLDENNLLVITGRREEIIKKGGLFVSLKEVEFLVKNLDGIEEVAAVKIKHNFYGENYVLFVKSQNDLINNDLKDKLSLWIHNNLVKYKWPEQIIFIKELPKTSSGKVKKGILGEQYEKQLFNAN